MNNDIQRTPEDHALICRLVDHHEQMLAKLEQLAAKAHGMADCKSWVIDFNEDTFAKEGYESAAKVLYKEIKELFNFAETLKDY